MGVSTKAAGTVEKSLADFMCRLFGDSLSPLQPTNVAELGYMRYLTTMRRVVLRCCYNTPDGPDSSMRAKAASLAPDEKTVLWVSMAKVVVEQRVELAEPDSESCIFKNSTDSSCSSEQRSGGAHPLHTGC
jgi:hypothetical protein